MGCECLSPKMEPIPTNTRQEAKAIFDQKLGEKPWFGIEQEYTLFEKDGRTPLGWPSGGYPGPQGPYYCSAGTDWALRGNRQRRPSLDVALLDDPRVRGPTSERHL